MTRLQFGWRVALVAFLGCSLVIVVAGWTFTQFDSQYEASSVAERILVGVPAGLFAVAIFSPIVLFASAIVGVVAGVRHGHQRRRISA